MITAKPKALLLKASVAQSLHGQLSGFSPASAHKSNVKTSLHQSNVRSWPYDHTNTESKIRIGMLFKDTLYYIYTMC